jgi:hypothetical protein
LWKSGRPVSALRREPMVCLPDAAGPWMKTTCMVARPSVGSQVTR